MKLTVKSSKLTYKTLFGYSLVVIALLLLGVPVLANARPGSGFLDFSLSQRSGDSIETAQTLSQGINLNHLNPGQENWYSYSREGFNDPDLSWVSLALRYESEAQLDTKQVNFQIFAGQQGNSWFQAAETPAEALGTGLVSPLRAGNQSITEIFWTGHVAAQELYYVRVYNNSPFPLDYTLEAKGERPAVTGALPASFAAAANAVPANVRQLAWTLTAQAVENMSASEAALWMQQAQAVGWLVTEGTLPQDVPDPGQGNPQVLWSLTAQAIEGQNAQAASQWLIQADSLGWLSIPLHTLKNPIEDVIEQKTGDDGDQADPEPAARPVPPEPVYTPVNIYPNNPLPFALNNVNSGRLGPYGEHWYELRRDDLDEELFEQMKMTMFFTPIQGYLSNRINFEIFTASQYHIWQRGDSDYMDNLGLGMWVSRDEDPNTGERLWNGMLVDGDTYLIKVKNGTPQEVDYYLFPDDVENSELGNPNLYYSDRDSGYVPYILSPPTRSGPALSPDTADPDALSLR